MGSLHAGTTYPDSRSALVHKYFPGAKGADSFLAELQNELRKHGLHSSDTIALANLCRDEATDKLKLSIDRQFNDSFNINGLGGVLTCGVTGVKAGLSHSPQVGGHEQYVFFSFPHVAVDAKAGLGKIQRPGREHASSACGALIAAHGALQKQGASGLASTGLDTGDLEFSVLKQRLGEQIQKEGVSNDKILNWTLADVTKVAERAITADLEALISKAVDPSKSNYAVVTGVHIHSWPAAGEKGPTLEYLWVQKAYVVVNGKRTDLGLAAKSA